MKLKTLILSLALIINSSLADAKNVELLTFDKSETSLHGLPRNFRDLSSFNLNAIASGQFSEKELLEVRHKYPTDKIIIVDLRRETHGLINGIAVSWREQFDKSNDGRKTSEILQEEKSRFSLVKKDGEILVNRIIQKDKKNGWYSEVKPEILEVTDAISEEDLVKKYGFEYKRFPIQDHAKPSEKQFYEIINFIKALPKDKKVYVHCAGGKGRTTTFLTLYDIIKNGDKLTLEEILKRQYKAGGSDLSSDDDEENWRADLAREKLELIQKFYAENKAKKSAQSQ